MKRMTLGFAFGKRKGRPAVLLVQKSSPPWQEGKLNGVGGKMIEGENAFECMVREFEEETGVRTECEDWTHRLTMHGHGWEVFVFRTDLDNLYIARQTTKKDKPVVCETNALPENVLFNLHWIIPLLADKEAPRATVVYPSFETGISSKPDGEN